MKPHFILIHGEAQNCNADSLCHLILVPVVAGIPQKPFEFVFNPESDFDFVLSGISLQQIENAPKLVEIWQEIQSVLNGFGCVVCSSEGYTARVLYGTLTRLGIPFNSFRYCNAKSLCRRSFKLFTYNFSFLCERFLECEIDKLSPVGVASCWAQLAILAFGSHENGDILDVIDEMGVTLGLVAPREFVPSCVKRLSYSQRQRPVPFDPTAVTVNECPDNPFYRMNVVFTGKLESLTRDQARTEVVKLGGFAPERLTKDTDFLVVGKQDLRVVGEKGLSGKMKTAEKYCSQGIPIEVIDETDFLEMIRIR